MRTLQPFECEPPQRKGDTDTVPSHHITMRTVQVAWDGILGERAEPLGAVWAVPLSAGSHAASLQHTPFHANAQLWRL